MVGAVGAEDDGRLQGAGGQQTSVHGESCRFVKQQPRAGFETERNVGGHYEAVVDDDGPASGEGGVGRDDDSTHEEAVEGGGEQFHALLYPTLQAEMEGVGVGRCVVGLALRQRHFDSDDDAVATPHLEVGGMTLVGLGEVLPVDIHAESAVVAPLEPHLADTQALIATVVHRQRLCGGRNGGDERVEDYGIAAEG